MCPPNELYHKTISVPRETPFMQTIIIFEHTDHTHGRRKDFLIGEAQSETTHRVVSNLYNNLWNLGGHTPPVPPGAYDTCIILLHFYRTSGTGTVTTMHTRIKPRRSWPFYKSSLGWQNGGRSSRHPASPHLINEPHSSITNHTNTIHSCTIALARPEQLANVLDKLKRHIFSYRTSGNAFTNLHIILLISIPILHLVVYI